ncbi:hypothetical protein, partial [Gluconacetobacter diazotrophicus]|uniref:hypothetical protein n=1 Tax=Gluconacetobacter diazotrophicus TaxID=33996 RepID=UPI001C7F8B29
VFDNRIVREKEGICWRRPDGLVFCWMVWGGWMPGLFWVFGFLELGCCFRMSFGYAFLVFRV